MYSSCNNILIWELTSLKGVNIVKNNIKVRFVDKLKVRLRLL